MCAVRPLSYTVYLASFGAHISDILRSLLTTQFPGRQCVFESWPMGFHKVRTSPRPPEMPTRKNQRPASDSSLSFRQIR